MFIGFAIASLGTAHSAELFKRLKVKQKAISQIIALIMSGLVGIVMAYNGLAYWGIAAQNVVYVTMVNLCYWLFSPWRPTFNFDFRPIKEMFGFSSKILITNVFTQLNGNIFPFFWENILQYVKLAIILKLVNGMEWHILL